MYNEQGSNQPVPTIHEVYGFSEKEKLYDQVSSERLAQILADERTTVHEVQESYNNFGEWLFITVSRPSRQQPISVSFYGLGYHEHRERWYTDRWFYYRANNFPERLEQKVRKEDVNRLIEERQAAIAPYVTNREPSARAQLFDLLATLTDEDGAYIELEDLGPAADWLLSDDEA